MSIAATCEQCRTQFDPVTGGICAECGRLLCARHLRGWRPFVFALFERAQPVCVACRRAAGASGDAAPSGRPQARGESRDG